MKFKDVLLISLIVVSAMFVMLYLFESGLFRLQKVSPESIPEAVVEVEEVKEIPLTTEEIADRVLRATVTIISYDSYGYIIGTGSGFFISPYEIITNYHVIDEARSVKYRIQGSDHIYSIKRIIDTDTSNDLAILESVLSNKEVISLSNHSVTVGQQIYVAGAPMRLEGTFSTGIVSAIRTHETGDWIQITAPISPGSSGGPVVNAKAELVGVTVASQERGQNLNFAIPSRYIRYLSRVNTIGKPVQEPRVVERPISTPIVAPFTCGGILKDLDGHTYKTVRISENCWMAENLRTTTYSNGDRIVNVPLNSNWSSSSTGAWSHYANNSAYEVLFGKLYNWKSVEDSRGLCPTGWRVPSDTEWRALASKLGDNAGHILKTTSGWLQNGNGSNILGFSAQPGGYRSFNGDFMELGTHGFWHTANQFDDTRSRYVIIRHDRKSLRLDYGNKQYGFSVRCISEQGL
jgi:uncharacterized protein (TIGR02145 family)